jgi:hypothetical protein
MLAACGAKTRSLVGLRSRRWAGGPPVGDAAPSDEPAYASDGFVGGGACLAYCSGAMRVVVRGPVPPGPAELYRRRTEQAHRTGETAKRLAARWFIRPYDSCGMYGGGFQNDRSRAFGGIVPPNFSPGAGDNAGEMGTSTIGCPYMLRPCRLPALPTASPAHLTASSRSSLPAPCFASSQMHDSRIFSGWFGAWRGRG